ncbi:hypothetical protein [Mycolicibacter senuensis]|nr:hypothetical protein [Mycolicibacter senuensis]
MRVLAIAAPLGAAVIAASYAQVDTQTLLVPTNYPPVNAESAVR